MSSFPSPPTPATSHRVERSFALRTLVASNDASILPPPQIDNGDEIRYPDKCGTYSKGILQAGVGRVDLTAYHSFRRALNSGDPADFAAIQVGGSKTLNGPQGGL